jgi:hypothetical protein
MAKSKPAELADRQLADTDLDSALYAYEDP